MTTLAGRTPGRWTADVPDETWARVLDCLRDAVAQKRTVVLACHADPDGDALGSMLALHLWLRRQGVDSTATWGSEPFRVPPQYTFLPGLDTLTPPDEVPDAPDLLVTLDTASPARLGCLSDLPDRAGTVLVVDHHASATPFGDVLMVAPRAAATAIIVEELLHRLAAELDRELASCLYVGLVTDTGRFQYSNTDPAAMELGGRLLDAGIEHEEMTRQIFETHSFGFLKVQARVLDRATFVPEASLVYSWVTQEDLQGLGVAMEETESLIDVLRTVDAAELSLIAKESQPGVWRVSMRSKGSLDVGRLAQELGGGGHDFAAGFTASGDVSSIVASVRARLEAWDDVTGMAG